MACERHPHDFEECLLTKFNFVSYRRANFKKTLAEIYMMYPRWLSFLSLPQESPSRVQVFRQNNGHSLLLTKESLYDYEPLLLHYEVKSSFISNIAKQNRQTKTDRQTETYQFSIKTKLTCLCIEVSTKFNESLYCASSNMAEKRKCENDIDWIHLTTQYSRTSVLLRTILRCFGSMTRRLKTNC